MSQILTVSEIYGGEQQLLQRVASQIGFNIHVSLPGVIQKYNSGAQTVEVQPSIREKVIGEGGRVLFLDYPLLINVPVAFPQAGGFSINFPVEQGDECIVIFSDLAIDNWWLKGSVQNPIEQRRHDLSDGMAILGLSNQAKLKNRNNLPKNGALTILDEKNGSSISLYGGGGSISAVVQRPGPPGGQPSVELETVTFEQIIKKVNPGI